jgi:hypothetical protein
MNLGRGAMICQCNVHLVVEFETGLLANPRLAEYFLASMLLVRKNWYSQPLTNSSGLVSGSLEDVG